MKSLSTAEKNSDKGIYETKVTLDSRESDALDAAVNWYLQKHKDDPSDNIIQRLKVLAADLHNLGNELKPQPR